jgi:hypothetical protein
MCLVRSLSFAARLPSLAFGLALAVRPPVRFGVNGAPA